MYRILPALLPNSNQYLQYGGYPEVVTTTYDHYRTTSALDQKLTIEQMREITYSEKYQK